MKIIGVIFAALTLGFALVERNALGIEGWLSAIILWFCLARAEGNWK